MIKVKTNSNKVKKGDIFVAIKGFTTDGHKYIDSAIEKGASKIICEYGEYEGAEIFHVDDTKKWLNDYLLDNYKDKINQMKFIGVTGTNGKTTTCFLTYETLKQLGDKVCYIGTIGYYDDTEHYELPNTTPSMIDLYTILLNALDKGIETVVMEVSSHSLVEKRIAGIEFNTIAYTNLTQDHLDFHGDMDNYFKAKLQLLDYVREDGMVLVNNDDPHFKLIESNNLFSYGVDGKDLIIKSYEDTPTGTRINFIYNGKEYAIDTLLKNNFNVYNYLMSAILSMSVGHDFDEVISLSDSIYPPKGRCDRVPFEDGNIIIDYAHTPDAVEKIITSFKETTPGRIFTLIGCGGDRDKTKRPIMGEIASKNSTYVLITSDNPRTEDPEKIIDDIIAGITDINYIRISDRKEAIKMGINMLKKGDTLLILGKGHENYQIIGTVKYPFDDREVALEYIEERKKIK